VPKKRNETMRNCIRFACRVALTLIATINVSGCINSGGTSPLSELAESDHIGAEYKVRKGDSLSIEVWGEPKLSSEVFVREDGRLTLPLIKDVPAEGLTLERLGFVIEKMLQEFVPAASVTVSVAQQAPIKYYLLGAVTQPGEFRSAGQITFLQALATGGSFAPFADRSSIILIRTTDSGEVRYRLNYDKVLSGQEPNPRLMEGDIITVN